MKGESTGSTKPFYHTNRHNDVKTNNNDVMMMIMIMTTTTTTIIIIKNMPYACFETDALRTSQLTRTYGSFKLMNNYYSNLFTKLENVSVIFTRRKLFLNK